MMSSTTRSTSSSANRAQRLLAVARLNDAIAVPLERVREELLDRSPRRRRAGWWRRSPASRIGRLARARPAPYYSPRRGAGPAPRRRRRAGRAAAPSSGPIDTAGSCGRDARRAGSARRRRLLGRSARALPRAGAAAVVRRCLRPALALELARDYPRPRARFARRRRRDGVGEGEARALRARHDGRRLGRDVPGLGTVRLRNLVTVVPGAPPTRSSSSPTATTPAPAPGANDNASGTAALIELARGVRQARHLRGPPRDPVAHAHLPLLGRRRTTAASARAVRRAPRSTATTCRRRLARRPRRRRAAAARDRGRSSPARPRHRSCERSATRVAEQPGEEPRRPGWLAQLVDLGLPFGYGEQAPFLGREISAIRLGDGDGRGPVARPTSRARSTGPVRALGPRLGVDPRSLDGGIELARGTAGYVYLGSRVVRGWAIQLVLLAALVPFPVGAIDLFARSRRRRPAPCRPRVRRFRIRLLCLALGRARRRCRRRLPASSRAPGRIPPPPDSPAITDWPVAGLPIVVGLVRARLVGPRAAAPRREATRRGGAGRLRGRALVALGAVGPSRRRSQPLRPGVFVCPRSTRGSGCRSSSAAPLAARPPLRGRAGGPGAGRSSRSGHSSGSGTTPLYARRLMTLGFIPWTRLVLVLVWAAAAAQLGALAAGRYATGGATRVRGR